jgi:hypothetical protein
MNNLVSPESVAMEMVIIGEEQRRALRNHGTSLVKHRGVCSSTTT